MLRCLRYTLAIAIALTVQLSGLAQVGWIEGTVGSSDGSPLPGATVIPVDQASAGMVTDQDGKYRIQLTAGVPYTIRFGFVGYRTEQRVITPIAGDTLTFAIRLQAGVALATSEVFADGERTSPVQRIDPKVASRIPSPRGTIEDLLIQAPVNFNSELSSGYNVRGAHLMRTWSTSTILRCTVHFWCARGNRKGCPSPTQTWSSRSLFLPEGLKPNSAIN